MFFVIFLTNVQKVLIKYFSKFEKTQRCSWVLSEHSMELTILPPNMTVQIPVCFQI